MNFDNTVSIYCRVASDDTFDEAAKAVFSMVAQAQARYPDWPRTLYLEIEGHMDASGRLADGFIEFQQEFWFSVIAPFLTAFELPLTGPLVNPVEQRNDIADELVIKAES